MGAMKVPPALLLLSAALGCSSAPSAAPAAPAGRPEGLVIVGRADGKSRSSCDVEGRWEINGAKVEHWLFQPDDKREFTTMDGARSFGLFRGTIPFPYFEWTPSDFQVNQLIYPAGDGFVAMYHVMNHGADTRTCRLFVGLSGADASAQGRTLTQGGKPVVTASEAPVATKEGSKGRAALAYDFDVPSGASKFLFLTTPELGGKPAPEQLDQAAAGWEQALAKRRLTVPQRRAMWQYYADRAAAALGVAGCEARAAELEAQLAKPEGDAIRLLGGVPEPWLNETIEATGLPTPHGPLSFRFEGSYFTRALELGEGCRPPGGFLLAVPEKLKARIDGKDVDAKGGVLRVPAGSKRVDLSARE
jgi:hypothetical protein